MRALFLDRDGVINKRIPGSYVIHPNQFEFLPGALNAIQYLGTQFDKVLVVTNQQGVGKGIFSELALDAVHSYMLEMIKKAGGRIDNIYACTKLAKDNPPCRKPNTGMGLQAKEDFPEIDFSKSVMVGDSISDMEFAQRLGMTAILIPTKEEEFEGYEQLTVKDRFMTLAAFADSLEGIA